MTVPRLNRTLAKKCIRRSKSGPKRSQTGDDTKCTSITSDGMGTAVPTRVCTKPHKVPLKAPSALAGSNTKYYHPWRCILGHKEDALHNIEMGGGCKSPTGTNDGGESAGKQLKAATGTARNVQ